MFTIFTAVLRHLLALLIFKMTHTRFCYPDYGERNAGKRCPVNQYRKEVRFCFSENHVKLIISLHCSLLHVNALMTKYVASLLVFTSLVTMTMSRFKVTK